MELYRQRDSQRPRYVRDHQAERDAAAWQKVREALRPNSHITLRFWEESLRIEAGHSTPLSAFIAAIAGIVEAEAANG